MGSGALKPQPRGPQRVFTKAGHLSSPCPLESRKASALSKPLLRSEPVPRLPGRKWSCLFPPPEGVSVPAGLPSLPLPPYFQLSILLNVAPHFCLLPVIQQTLASPLHLISLFSILYPCSCLILLFLLELPHHPFLQPPLSQQIKIFRV